MAGFGKRQAQHVPAEFRRELDKLSKADLMEIAFSFAARINGEELDGAGAYALVKEEHELLAAAYERKPIKLETLANA